MVKSNQFKDPNRLALVKELKQASKKQESRIWDTVADELSRVRKNRRVVNLYKINKHTSEGDVVVIPGKVLGTGVLDHGVSIAAYQFSEGAMEKIQKAGGKALKINELLDSNPKGSNVKIMG